MINELIENYGFVKYSCLECKDGDVILPPQKNRLNVLYAIVVDDELVYIYILVRLSISESGSIITGLALTDKHQQRILARVRIFIRR